MFKIIDQSPSRRGDYWTLTRGIYRLQFCSRPLPENQIVAERAIDLWVLVVNYWMGLPKAKQPKEGNKSYSQTEISDSLISINFKFFAAAMVIPNSFLVKLQTNNPMVPFLAQTIEEIMHLFGSTFLLKLTWSQYMAMLV